MNDFVTCPECKQGKHSNCDGSAYDMTNDAIVVCDCTVCDML